MWMSLIAVVSLLLAETPATLYWDPPAGDLNGYAGYVLRWGPDPGGPYTHSMTTDMSATKATVMLTLGRWYFVVESFSVTGQHSAYSNEVAVDSIGVEQPTEEPKPGRRRRPNAPP